MNDAGSLVSVVVCTYNGEAHLRDQLHSLAHQSYTNLDILISDDRSTDSTINIANSFTEKDPRFRIIVQEKNVGYNANFESAFRKARGEFIAVCDQDDIWKTDKIEKMLKLFVNDNIVLAHAQSIRFTDTLPTQSHQRSRKLFEGNDIRQVMFFNTVAGHNMMFRRNLLEKISSFPPDVYYDWWLLICAAAFGTVKATDEVLTYHRYHESNLTLGKKDEGRQTAAKASERLATIRRILDLPGLSPSNRKLARELEHALQELSTKPFSFSLFTLLARNANSFFFFKKKSWFSKIKMAYRMSFAKK